MMQHVAAVKTWKSTNSSEVHIACGIDCTIGIFVIANDWVDDCELSIYIQCKNDKGSI